MMEYDLSTLLPLLGNLGAPLSVSVMLFYLMYRQQRAMNEALQRTLTIIELIALDNCRESLAEEEAATIDAASDEEISFAA